jgi:hypothetical protein
MLDTTTVSLKAQQNWTPRVDLTLMGPTSEDQSHLFGYSVDAALDALYESGSATAAIVKVTGTPEAIRRVLLMLGASDD